MESSGVFNITGMMAGESSFGVQSRGMEGGDGVGMVT